MQDILHYLVVIKNLAIIQAQLIKLNLKYTFLYFRIRLLLMGSLNNYIRLSWFYLKFLNLLKRH